MHHQVPLALLLLLVLSSPLLVHCTEAPTNAPTNATSAPTSAATNATSAPTHAPTQSPMPQLGPSDHPLPVLASQLAKVQNLATYMHNQWAALDAACDPRAVFAVAYLYMTANAAHLIQIGYFDDGNKMADFIVHFAARYSTAYDNWANGNTSAVSSPWLEYFSFVTGNHSDVTQDITLGMNAHINYDLAIATFEMGYVNASLTADYYRVNDLMQQVDDNITLALGRYDAQFYNTDWVSQTYFHTTTAIVTSWRTGAYITATSYQVAADLPLGAIDNVTVAALELTSMTTASAVALLLMVPYPQSTAPARIAYCMTQNQLSLPGVPVFN